VAGPPLLNEWDWDVKLYYTVPYHTCHRSETCCQLQYAWWM